MRNQGRAQPLLWLCVLSLAVGMAASGCGSRAAAPGLESDVFVADNVSSAAAEQAIRPLLAEMGRGGPLPNVVVDYPSEGSIFPPEIVAPTFLWHDPDNATTRWLIDVSFKTTPRHVYGLTAGRRAPREIDPRAVTETNSFSESPYQASAKGWTPDAATWALIKRQSVESDARVTIMGVASGSSAVTSRGAVSLRTSRDPVGAQVFYRDVPLMPTETTPGVVKPLPDQFFPMVQWHLRDLSKPDAPVVLEYLPTCGNCHSFSLDGKTLAMDIDGHDGDKGTRVMVPISRHMFIGKEDVFSWNRSKGPHGQESYGLFPQVSPDGRYDIATVYEAESVYARNYMHYGFLQTFYPTRGVLAFYDRSTGKVQTLPGADDPRYVHTNPVWSPDQKTLYFLRAEARPSKEAGRPDARFANDPNEIQIQYDICRIPFNEGKGGVAEPVSGASGNNMSNTFPRVSPDGKWIIFVQNKNGLLMRPDSELYILPVAGGTARRLNCNVASKMNSWHSWSPNSRWLVFASKRNTPYTEMFLTHIDENGNDSPAILVPNSTAANRAMNLPEFANIPPGAIEDITTPAVDYVRYLDKAKKLIDRGLYAEALPDLEKSLESKSDYPRTLAQYSTVLSQLGRQDEAVAAARKATIIAPKYGAAQLALGTALGRQEKYDEAIVAFKRTLEILPTSSGAEYGWASCLQFQGKLDEALAHYRKAAEFRPGYANALYNVGAILAEQGKSAEAVGPLRDALNADPAHWPALNTLARILATSADASLRDGKQAVRLAESACVGTGWSHPATLDTLACAYAEAGRFDDAVRMADKALEAARAAKDRKLAAEAEAHRALFAGQTPFRCPK